MRGSADNLIYVYKYSTDSSVLSHPSGCFLCVTRAGTACFVTYWWSNGCRTRCAWHMFETMGRARGSL